MAGRLPSPSHFPSKLNCTIIPPPATAENVTAQKSTNVLILLHGLGDTLASFTTFGRNMALPETACISLQAPTPLPFDLPGFHWGDDIVFNSATGVMDFDAGFSKSSRIIAEDVIQNGLIAKCGYKPREILMFGFGQGAMAALTAALRLNNLELGGVISIGGPLPSSVFAATSEKAKTPVLILGGSSSSLVTSPKLKELDARFDNVQYVKWNKDGDSMPRNHEEMLPIMRFFAQRLRSMRGIPHGCTEIS